MPEHCRGTGPGHFCPTWDPSNGQSLLWSWRLGVGWDPQICLPQSCFLSALPLASPPSDAFALLSVHFPEDPTQCSCGCRKWGPLPGPESGLLSNTQKWIVWRDTHVDKARDFIGKWAPRWQAGGWGNPGELLCNVALDLGFYSDGDGFWVVSDQPLWLRVLHGGPHIAQPRWIPTRRVLGGHMDWRLLSPFDLPRILGSGS